LSVRESGAAGLIEATLLSGAACGYCGVRLEGRGNPKKLEELK
jgi:hypothetical protein